jgi:hypothetical protein
MQTALQRAQGQAGAATVAFTDMNGPKRRADIRCAMVIGLFEARDTPHQRGGHHP